MEQEPVVERRTSIERRAIERLKEQERVMLIRERMGHMWDVGLTWPTKLIDIIYDRFDLWFDRERRLADHAKVRNFMLYNLVVWATVWWVLHVEKVSIAFLWYMLCVLGASISERVFISLAKAWSGSKLPMTAVAVEHEPAPVVDEPTGVPVAKDGVVLTEDSDDDPGDGNDDYSHLVAELGDPEVTPPLGVLSLAAATTPRKTAFYDVAVKVSQALPKVDVTIALGLDNFQTQMQAREGVMWHYDASTSDHGALSWFRNPDFQFSYNRVYTDDGRRVQLVGADGDRSSFHRAAKHAGLCRKTAAVRSANSAFYGLCITATNRQKVTDQQYRAIVEDTAAIFRTHGWGASEVEKRLVGHNEWAVFETGKLGRKIDPVGSNPKTPVLSLAQGRKDVAALLAR